MRNDQTPYSGSVRLGEITLALIAAGQPRAISEREVLIPGGPVTVLHPYAGAEFFRHGWNSWSPSGWRGLNEAPLRIYDSPERLLTADDAANDTPDAHSGASVGALAIAGGEIILLGSLGLGAPRVGATESTLWGTAEDHVAEWYLARGGEQEVFAGYARLLAERAGSRDGRAGRVWCSWYSFFEEISAERIRQSVEGLADMPFDVVQLDDGWERAVGDWTANDRFPAGMAATAQTITDAGFRAGLWLAPLIALPDSAFARERPELLVHGEDGHPLVAGYNWGGPYFALDTTQPEVVDHLRELFARVVGWGFRYLKLDFMYAGALVGRRHLAVHREQAYRDAIAVIRQAVGDEVYLLGCGAPIVPSLGIFDGIRVGPDVAAYWDNAERPRDPSGSGARNAFLASIHRAWLRPAIETDPDVAYFRRRRSLLDEPQRQLLEDLATILGFKSTSDPARWLTGEEISQLRAWLERTEHVVQEGRYRFRIDGRSVDLEAFIDYEAPASTVAG